MNHFVTYISKATSLTYIHVNEEFSYELFCDTGSSKLWKTFDCIQSDRLGMGDKPDYYTVKGFVAYVKKENCMYTVSFIYGMTFFLVLVHSIFTNQFQFIKKYH